MTLFSQLTPEVEALLSEHSEMINKNLKEWIENQQKVDSDLPKRVLEMVALVKRRQAPMQGSLKCTPERVMLIRRLISRGYEMKHFKGVVEYLVDEWYGTKMQKNLTPETMFAAANFTKYLEQAREAYLEKTKALSTGIKPYNPYEQQFTK